VAVNVMMEQQLAPDLPVTLLRWLASFAPIAILLLLLVWRRWSTSSAAPVALAAAVATALLLMRTPLTALGVATGKGIWDAIFVLYVIWPSLILYNVAADARAFEAIQEGVRRIMPDRLLVVLAFSWILASFIQAIAGFGTPLAVTVPLLIGLGVRPVYAVVLPMIGAAWVNPFGSLGATWLATLTVVDLPNEAAALRYAATLLWVPNLAGGLFIAWAYGRWWALKRAGPAIVVISAIHGGLQYLLVPLFPTIGAFLATSAALAVTFGLNRWSYYRQHDVDEPNLIFEEWAHIGGEEEEEAASEEQPRGEDAPPMSLALAFAPYAILGVLAIVALIIQPVREVLEQVRVGIPFPATTTGYTIERAATGAYAAFTPLTHPGTLLLVSAAASYLLYRARGLFRSETSIGSVIGEAAEDALPATTAITALLVISKVMDHSGQITVLALGVTAVAGSLVYLASSILIGTLGSLITSSNTASNVLFAPLQATAAEVEGLSVDLVVAAQTAGGAIGNAVSPGDALLGATVAGITAQLGAVLQRAIPWVLVVGLITAGATVAIHLLLV